MHETQDITNVISSLETSVVVQQQFHGSQLNLSSDGLVINKTLDHGYSNEERLQKMVTINELLNNENMHLFATLMNLIVDYYPVVTLDYYAGRDLGYVLEHQIKHKLTQTQKLIIGYGITKALHVLHTNNIIHPNFKLSNVLIDENYYPHVSDVITSNTMFESEKFSDNINDLIKILQTIDSKCDSEPLFAEIVEEYKESGNTMTIDQILASVNNLIDNRHGIDLNSFNDYQMYISSNTFDTLHGTYENIKNGANRGLENATNTIDSIRKTLINEKLIY